MKPSTKPSIILLVVAMAIFIGCGIRVTTDPVQVQGNVTVTHTIVVSGVQLEEFYKAYCETKFTTQADVDQCVTDSLALFWQAVNSSAPAPTTGAQ